MKVLLDTCVLYPTVMRDVLLGAAEKGLFQPLWSPRILEEWARAVARNLPGQEVVARGEIARICAAWPRASIQPKPSLTDRLWLPDQNDIHVLAAAIAGHADVIITNNAKDFPRHILAEEGLSRADPDAFLLGLAEAQPALLRQVTGTVRAEAERLSGEDWPLRKLMKKARLPRLGKFLERHGG